MEPVVLQKLLVEMDSIIDDESMRPSNEFVEKAEAYCANEGREINSSESLPGLKADVYW